MRPGASREDREKMKVRLYALFAVAFFLGTSLFFSAIAQEPLVMLIQAQGPVWYSTGGEQWKPVTRNKFLYEGWKVKTGVDASCKLLHQNSNEVDTLAQETEVTVAATGTRVNRGSVTSEKTSSTLPGHLKRKLAKVQKYTTVARSAKNKDRMDFRTAGRVLLNEDYPDLAWENAGKEYSYRLTLGGKFLEVPGSGEPVIRYTVRGLAPGEYLFLVQVLYQGEVIYTPEQTGTLVWMDEGQKRELAAKLGELDGIDRANGYLLGNLLDDEGLKVAAMDHYRAYLKEHPDANEVRPFLVKVLHELGFAALREKEALLYKQNIDNS